MSSPVKLKDQRIRLLGIPLVGGLVSWLFFSPVGEWGLVAFLYDWLITTAHTAVFWEGGRAIYRQARRWFPAVSLNKPRLLWIAVLSLLFGMTFALFAYYGLHALLAKISLTRAAQQPSLVDEFKSAFIPLLGCGAIYEGVFYFKQLQQALVQAEQLKKANAESQLEALKNQVNPHFLFNSLNTLTTLIDEDSALAIQFVQKLARVYRYVLDINEVKSVPLADELTALQSYLFLLQIRFGPNLHVDLNLPDNVMAAHIVPLALQMLVENAVKHNTVSSHKPLQIRIFLENNRLIVQNYLQPKQTFIPKGRSDSTGLGLDNIRQRYQLLASQSVDIIVTTQQFIVSLPLLPATVYEPVTY